MDADVFRRLYEFTRVENSVRVQGEFDGAVEFAGRGGDGEGPPAFFRQADAVLAADGTAPGDDLFEQVVEGGLAAIFRAGLGVIDHDIAVDVAIAGVTETGQLESVFLLELGGELEEFLKPAARDDDVLV